MLSALALVLFAQSGPISPTGATLGVHLLIADGDGTVRAWTGKDLKLDEALTRKLNGDGLLAIAREKETLWGFDGTRVFTWDDASAQWDLVPSKPPKTKCQAFAVVDGKPVGLCGPGVHRFTDGKYGEERNAVGGSSGISQLLPLGGGRLLLIPKSGEPLVVSAGKVSPLRVK